MKKSNAISLLAYFAMMACLLNSCKKEDIVFSFPEAEMHPVLMRSVTESSEYPDLIFHLDFALLQPNGTNTLLSPTDTHSIHFPSGNTYAYNILDFQLLNPAPENSFCTALLIDQSANYEYFGGDQLFEGLNSFMHNTGAGNSALIAGYARNNQQGDSIYTICGNGFIKEWDKEQAKDVFSLFRQTEGTPCLYDALYNMIEYVDAHGEGVNKSIVVLASNEDDGMSKYSLDQIISNAVEKNIKIHVIWLHWSNDYFELMYAAHFTGGFLSYCSNMAEVNMLYLSLPQLLLNQMNFYRIKVNRNKWPSPYIYPFGHSFTIFTYEDVQGNIRIYEQVFFYVGE